MTQALCPLSEAPVLLDSLIAALKGLTGTLAIVAFEMSGQRVGAMDVLSDVLRVVRLSGAVFFTADFSSPWAIESPVPARAGIGRHARRGIHRPVSHSGRW